MAKKIPPRDLNPGGLHQRYKVEKTDGTPVDKDAVYFVLRLDNKGQDRDHIVACRLAALTYCDHAPPHLAVVAKELRELVNKLREESGETRSQPHT